MKKIVKGLLLAVFTVAMIGCKGSVDEGSKFSLSNYQFTDEVKLMETAQEITGSADLNLNSGNIGTGAFPNGRTVTLSPFIMGKYEVTQELYEAVMTGQKVTAGGEQKVLNANPSICISTINAFKNMLSGEEQKYRPVEGVTWYDACYFCNALSEKLGLTKAYKITVNEIDDNGNIKDAIVEPVAGANGYRLPTEAEWEYAARGGSKATAEQFKYYFSGATTTNYSAQENSDINGVAWYYFNADNLGSGNAGYGTHQVGKKDANAAGLCDMSGNVWEWCYDWYATINTDAVTDPSGPSDAQYYRVFRGGSWGHIAYYCAVSSRNCDYPDVCYSHLGFRVVRSAK